LALQECGIPYMLVGSNASSIHGAPRATYDIDIVIDPTERQLEQLLALFPDSDFYVSVDAATDAFRRRSQFNLIEIDSGWKVDLIIPENRAFNKAEMARRSPRRINDVLVDVATAEDTIIAKLEWSKAGGSERQLEDVAGILRLRADALDAEYIEQWVQALELAPQWQRAQTLALQS
jgi:hypothetical protein